MEPIKAKVEMLQAITKLVLNLDSLVDMVKAQIEKEKR